MHGKKVKILRRTKPVPKRAYWCNGGPMHQATLYLTSPHTLIFTLAGQTGRYVRNMGAGLYDMVWEPHGAC